MRKKSGRHNPKNPDQPIPDPIGFFFRCLAPIRNRIGFFRGNPEILGHTNGFLGFHKKVAASWIEFHPSSLYNVTSFFKPWPGFNGCFWFGRLAQNFTVSLTWVYQNSIIYLRICWKMIFFWCWIVGWRKHKSLKWCDEISCCFSIDSLHWTTKFSPEESKHQIIEASNVRCVDLNRILQKIDPEIEKKHLFRFLYMSSLVFYVHHMFLNLRLVFFKDLQKKSLLKRPFTVSIHPSTFPTIPSLDAFHCQALTATSLVYATIIRAAVPPCHRRSRWPTGAGCRNPCHPLCPEK